MTTTLAILIASLAVNIICFFVIADLLDRLRASYDNIDYSGGM